MEFVGLNTLLSFLGDVVALPDWSGYVPELNFIAKFIKWMYEGIGSYGWTVIVFTIILKVVTFPLDIWQRVLAKKNAAITNEIKPLMENIDKQYPNDKNMQQQEKNKIMKKMGYSPASSCLPLIVTLVVFSIMFSGLNSYSAHINVQNYVDLEQQYITEYNHQIEQSATEIQAQEKAEEAVAAYFSDEIQEDFLWIKNIWRPDTWEGVMIDSVKFQKGGSGLVALQSGAPFNSARYDVIRQAVLEGNPGYFAKYDDSGVMTTNKKGELNSGWNGLVLLPVLAMGIMLLSSWISQKQNNPTGTNKNDPSQQSAKMMMFMMPIMFGIFGFMYTAAFSVYLVSNSLWSIIINFVTTPWINKMAEKSVAKKRIVEEKVSYRR